ncbi:hypothetical protein AMC87_CH02889 [Rhizobium phaseoli]|uniref:hypothetical protein n=1 Tax=Rhizobium phaseoli TaxID=396 RepID=UPI0007F0D1E4|nr:hypothetical protein [Rhizobium phaseoli]ANL47555.1 hypothetical protein AMC87_CH02889 [Rhizobium phaseoli]
MKHFCVVVGLSILTFANSAAGGDISDVIATIKCPYPIPQPFLGPKAFDPVGTWTYRPSLPKQGLGTSPILRVPLFVTSYGPVKGTSGFRVMIGVPEPYQTGASDDKGVKKAEESDPVLRQSVEVYPSATVDCVIKALSASLTAERKTTAEEKLLLTAVIARINELEASIPEKVNETPNAELLARVETLENELAEARSEVKELRLSRQPSP